MGMFEMGWGGGGWVGYKSCVGGLMMGVCLGVKIVMVVSKRRKSVKMELWK